MPIRSPFTNWASGLKAENLPPDQQKIASFFTEGFNIAGEQGAYYAQHRLGGPRVAIPGKVQGFEGLMQIGTSYFGMPTKAVSPSGQVIDITDVAYEEMRRAARDPLGYRQALRNRYPEKEFSALYPGAMHRIEGLKEASAEILDTSRSVISTALGPDYTLAFQRSRMMNILDMEYAVQGVEGRHRLRDLLAKMEELVGVYQRSGGRDLTQKQSAVDAFYQNLVAAVEGSSIGQYKLSISGIKDKLFREHGIASTLTASDVTYGVTLSGLGKGYQQFAKIQPFHERALQLVGLSTPAASGAAFAEESQYVSRLMGFEGYQAPGKYAARFGADTFLSMGIVSKEGQLSLRESRVLADSRSIAGKQLYDLTMHGRATPLIGGGIEYGPQVQPRTKTILLGGAEGRPVSSLEFHREIDNDMKELLRAHQEGRMRVPKGMKRTSAGLYMYASGPRTIARTEQYADDIDFFLGRSMAPTQGPVGPEDLKMALVGAGERSDQLDVLGYRISSKGGHAIDVIYQPRSVPGIGENFAERAMIVHGRRVMQRQTMERLATTGGRAVDQVLRAAELGIGKELGEDFFSAVMANWAEISRGQGKLGKFATFMGGHQLIEGAGVSPHVALTSNEAGLGTSLFNNISKVLTAKPQELAEIGLAPEDVSILKQQGERFVLNPSAIEYMSVQGELHAGIRLRGLETAMRAGQVDRMKIGPGAMSMRLHDMIPMVNEQWSAVDPKTQPKLYEAYGQLYAGIKGRILHGRTGRIGSIERRLPGASQELASIYQSLYNRMTPFQGGILEGVDVSKRVASYDEWLRTGARPLAPTQEGVRQILRRRRGMTQQMLQGTVHATGYRGEVVQLPKAIKVGITPAHAIETQFLPLPSDRFLGATPTEQGKFLSGSGIRNLGLLRKKALLVSLMHEEQSMIARGEYSPGFQRAFRDYMSSILAGMSGKDGLIYKNMVGQPAGAFNSVIVNWGSIPSGLSREQQLLSVGMHPDDARALLKHAGYGKQADKTIKRIISGQEKVFLNVARYPWHQGSNLGVMQLRVSKKIARDRIAVSDLFAQVAKGDFDKDMMVGMLLKDQQQALREIHTHRQKIMSSYDTIVRSREKQQLGKIVKDLTAGELGGAPSGGRAEIARKLATRLGSAAGGGVYVGPVHMGWARLNALTQAIGEKEGAKLIESISAIDAELGEQMKALSKDKGFRRLMGTTQETGIYGGSLKKGAKGFGSESTAALSGLIKYGEKSISLDEVKNVMRAGFQSAAGQGLFETSEVADYGIRNADEMTEALFRGQGHEGIGTIAKVRAIMKKMGVPDVSYEVARGYDPTRPGGSTAYFTKRAIDTAHAMAGESIPLTQGSPGLAEDSTRVLTRLIDDAAQGAPDTMERAVAKTMPEGQPGFLQNMSTQIGGIMESRWGKRIMIGAGVVLGIGALDAIFGASGDDPTPAQFVGTAPLPPRMDFDFPDADVGMPSMEQFAARARAPARIERPMAQRANYLVSATASENADFGYMMGGYQGSVGGPPTRDGYVTDATRRDMDLDYELRRRLRSSF